MTREQAIRYLSNSGFSMIQIDTIVKALEQEPTVEAIPKDQYETRLKADLKAMLTELQLEIEEIEIDVPFGFEPVSKTSAFYEGVSASSKVIQQKINALKADRSEKV